MKRRLPSSDARTTPAVAVLHGQEQHPRLFACTCCGLAKPAEAYARWGAGGTRFGTFLGTRSACDSCIDEVTRFPADMPVPVMFVDDDPRSGEPSVWRLSA